MKKMIVAISLGLACLLTGLSVRQEVRLGGHSAVVARTPGDGLDALASPAFSLAAPEALAACGSQDIHNQCCPTACEANNDPKKKSQANYILRGCMKNLGCKSGLSDGTVFSYCNCR